MLRKTEEFFNNKFRDLADDVRNEVHRSADDLRQFTQSQLDEGLSRNDLQSYFRVRDQTRALAFNQNIAALKVREESKSISFLINNRHPIKVLFLIHNKSAFETVKPVIYQMNESVLFDVTVASICHNFPGEENYSDEDVNIFLTETFSKNNSHFNSQSGNQSNISHIRINNNNLLLDLQVLHKINPDIIFRQSQWDDDVDEAFRTEHLAWTRTCMIPYGGVLLINPPTVNIDDQLYLRNCWKYFVPNQRVKDDLAAVSPLRAKNVVVTGHPKIQELLKCEASWPISEEIQNNHPSNKKLRILWSAHHTISDDWLKFGTFHYTYQSIINLAKNDQIEIVVSIHPTLLTTVKLPNSPIKEDKLNEIFDELKKYQNVKIVSGVEYGPLFKAADILIADSVSWLAEFQAFTKPLIYIEREGHSPFNSLGEMAKTGMDIAQNGDELEIIVKKYLDGLLRDGAVVLSKEKVMAQKQNSDYFFGVNNGKDAVLNIINEIIKD